MPSNSFLHSSYPSLRAVLRSISQLFRLHMNAPSWVKNSAQGFQTLLSSVVASLLNGQWSSLLQSTTKILCDALSCRRMKRPFFACISIQFQKSATVYVCNSETGYYISGPFELRNLNSSLLRGEVDGCFSLDGKHILVRCHSDAALFCHAAV